MKRIFYLVVVFFLGVLPVGMAIADIKFKIEMQNYTDAELKFYCKSIMGDQKWIFPNGNVSVPPRMAVTEEVKIARSSDQGPHEEIQCHYSAEEGPIHAFAANNQGLPLRVIEKTTDSITVDASFGGILTLVVTPTISKNTKTHQVLDTHSEFMVSFEDR